MDKVKAMIEADYDDAHKALQEMIEGKHTFRVPKPAPLSRRFKMLPKAIQELEAESKRYLKPYIGAASIQSQVAYSKKRHRAKVTLKLIDSLRERWMRWMSMRKVGMLSCDGVAAAFQKKSGRWRCSPETSTAKPCQTSTISGPHYPRRHHEQS